jgi:hypothetical protein
VLPKRFALVFAVALLLIACGSGDDDTAVPPPILTFTPTPTPVATPTPATPPPPANVRVEGQLPLTATVTPGEGESGRITVIWEDRSQTETGFRIYQECAGSLMPILDTPPDETRYGPLQPCRPGRVGVASFNGSGISAIVFAP